MSTLFDAVLGVYRELGAIKRGEVTAQGSDTDKIFYDANRPEPDTYFKAYETAIFFTKTTDGNAPQGEFQRLSAYDQDDSDQFTLENSLSADITVGDLYEINLPKYPVDLVINAINVYLGTLDIPQEDTSLTTVSGQSEYTIPATIPKWGLRQVWLETDKDDANDQRFIELHNCTQFLADTDSTNTIVLPRTYSDGYTIKLKYVAPHDTLYEDSDTINEHIAVKKLAAKVVPEVMRMQLDLYPSGDKTIGGRLNMAVERANRIHLQIPKLPMSGLVILPRIGK